MSQNTSLSTLQSQVAPSAEDFGAALYNLLGVLFGGRSL